MRFRITRQVLKELSRDENSFRKIYFSFKFFKSMQFILHELPLKVKMKSKCKFLFIDLLLWVFVFSAPISPPPFLSFALVSDVKLLLMARSDDISAKWKQLFLTNHSFGRYEWQNQRFLRLRFGITNVGKISTFVHHKKYLAVLLFAFWVHNCSE